MINDLFSWDLYLSAVFNGLDHNPVCDKHKRPQHPVRHSGCLCGQNMWPGLSQEQSQKARVGNMMLDIDVQVIILGVQLGDNTFHIQPSARLQWEHFKTFGLVTTCSQNNKKSLILFHCAGFSKPFNIYVHTDSLEGSSSPAEANNR